MKKLISSLLLLSVLASCNPNQNNTMVEFTVLSSGYGNPNNVQVFFQVKDEFGNPMDKLETNFEDHFELTDDGVHVGADEESKWVVKPDPKSFGNYTLLVLDISESVRRSHLDVLKNAAKQFISSTLKTNPNHLLQIAIFAGDEDIYRIGNGTYISDLAELHSDIDYIRPDGHWIVDDTTNLNGAIIKGVNDIMSYSGSQDPATNVMFRNFNMIVFTDGRDRADRKTFTEAKAAVESAKSKAKSQKNMSFNIFTVGLGNDIQDEQLAVIGKEGFYKADKQSDLQKKFNEVGQTISKIANSFYFFNLCSARRSNSHKLNLSLDKDIDGVHYVGVMPEVRYNANDFTGGCSLNNFANVGVSGTPLTSATPVYTKVFSSLASLYPDHGLGVYYMRSSGLELHTSPSNFYSFYYLATGLPAGNYEVRVHVASASNSPGFDLGWNEEQAMFEDTISGSRVLTYNFTSSGGDLRLGSSWGGNNNSVLTISKVEVFQR